MIQEKVIKKQKVKNKHLQCRCQTRKKQCTQTVSDNTVFCKHHSHSCEGSPMSGDEPVYNPMLFNNNPFIQHAHNCWAYGMDVLDPRQLLQCINSKGLDCDPRFHQPGGTKGISNLLQKAKGRTCKTVDYLMRQDVPGLTPSTFSAKCPVGKSKIAMVVHPGEDYHFYRQDSDGWWSHKDGGNKVKRFDADGKPIWNPQTASRDYRPKSYLNYKDFCGFYCAPRRQTIKLARGGKRKYNIQLRQNL